MLALFINISFFDILDILLLALFLYQLYLLIRGTIAFNIFIGLFLVYLFWLFIRALNMHTLESFLGQFIGLGVLALIIVFQQEIRHFLLMIGTRYSQSKYFDKLFSFLSQKENIEEKMLSKIIQAIKNMSNKKTGALVVIANTFKLKEYINTGILLNAVVEPALLETIFLKVSPLHDGAVIISDNKIEAAKCILPVSNNMKLPVSFGLRHRAGIGITEQTDAEAIIVSEETGNITYVKNGNITYNVGVKVLLKTLS